MRPKQPGAVDIPSACLSTSCNIQIVVEDSDGRPAKKRSSHNHGAS